MIQIKATINHRFTEWLGLEGTSADHPVQPPLPKQGHQQQAAQDHGQAGLVFVLLCRKELTNACNTNQNNQPQVWGMHCVLNTQPESACNRLYQKEHACRDGYFHLQLPIKTCIIYSSRTFPWMQRDKEFFVNPVTAPNVCWGCILWNYCSMKGPSWQQREVRRKGNARDSLFQRKHS